MKKNNMPLNLRERINSRISLLCSVVVLVLLVLDNLRSAFTEAAGVLSGKILTPIPGNA